MILKELYSNADMKAWEFAPKVKHNTEFKTCKITYSDGTIRYRPYYLSIIKFLSIVLDKSWYDFRKDIYIVLILNFQHQKKLNVSLKD